MIDLDHISNIDIFHPLLSPDIDIASEEYLEDFCPLVCDLQVKLNDNNNVRSLRESFYNCINAGDFSNASKYFDKIISVNTTKLTKKIIEITEDILTRNETNNDELYKGFERFYLAYNNDIKSMWFFSYRVLRLKNKKLKSSVKDKLIHILIG